MLFWGVHGEITTASVREAVKEQKSEHLNKINTAKYVLYIINLNFITEVMKGKLNCLILTRLGAFLASEAVWEIVHLV